MKRFFLAILLSVVVCSIATAAPANNTIKAGTESHFQTKKKSGKHHHHKKNHSGTKKASVTKK